MVFASAYMAGGYQSFFLADSVRKTAWLVNAIMGVNLAWWGTQNTPFRFHWILLT
jgi:hypothetical protein